MVLNQNPLLTNPAADNFHIPPGSPAAGAGASPAGTAFDYYGAGFAVPPSIGAIEANPVSGTGAPSERSEGMAVYPNPCYHTTTVRFVLPNAEAVTLSVFDRNGRLVRGLLNHERRPAGVQELRFERTGLAAGVYFIQLETSVGTETKRLLIF
jgi:hypothetical protein